MLPIVGTTSKVQKVISDNTVIAADFSRGQGLEE